MEDLVLSCLESRVEENRNLYARFLVGPFLKGDALTVATALRRVLLSSIESIGITALYIQGITHEFSTIVGVRESVLELSLNFQSIVLSYDKTFYKKKRFFDNLQVGYLQVQGPKVVYANDLKLPLGVKLVDPTQYIATLSKEGSLVLKFTIGKRNNFLHQNTGPESYFGNPALDLPIAAKVSEKNIVRAKKTWLYKNGSTIDWLPTKGWTKNGLQRQTAPFATGALIKQSPVLQGGVSFAEQGFAGYTKQSPAPPALRTAQLLSSYPHRGFGVRSDLPVKGLEKEKVKASLFRARRSQNGYVLLPENQEGNGSKESKRTPFFKAIRPFAKPSRGTFCFRKGLKRRESRVRANFQLDSLFLSSLRAKFCSAKPIAREKSHKVGFAEQNLARKELRKQKRYPFATMDTVSSGKKIIQVLSKSHKGSKPTRSMCSSLAFVPNVLKEQNIAPFASKKTLNQATVASKYFYLAVRDFASLKSETFSFSFSPPVKFPQKAAITKQGSPLLSPRLLNPYFGVRLAPSKSRFARYGVCKLSKSEVGSKQSRAPFCTTHPSLQKKDKVLHLKKNNAEKEDRNKKKILFLKSNNNVFKSNICLRNVIPLDFTLTPVLKVNFVVEIDDDVLYLRQKVRERIILEVWTNGSIYPQQAVHDAALCLTDIFGNFRSVYGASS